MSELPENFFSESRMARYTFETRHLAVSTSDACRYSADVVPFAAVEAATAEAMKQPRSLLAPGESTWLIGEQLPQITGLSCGETLECFQMAWRDEVQPPGPTTDIVERTDANADEMVALTSLAPPVFSVTGRTRWGRATEFDPTPAN